VQGVSHCPGAGFEGQKVRPACEGQGWRGLSQAQSLVVPPPALTLKWNVTMGSPVGQKRSQQRRSRHAHGDRSRLQPPQRPSFWPSGSMLFLNTAEERPYFPVNWFIVG